MKNFVKYTFVLAIAAMTFSACHRPGTYIVSFDANGGAGRMRSQVFDEGESQALFQNAYTRDNHTFTGWNTNQNGSGTAYTDGQTISISSDMILYAQWTANGSQGSGSQGGSGNEPGSSGNGTYTITFNANGGTRTMEPQSYNIYNSGYSEERLRENAFSRENYEFAYWSTEPDTSVYNPTGRFYNNGAMIFSINRNRNITLYAVWIAISGQHNGHNYVDLGLPSGTLWATCNVGANYNNAYCGNRFAWGETAPKDTYTWSSYIYCYGGDGWNGDGYNNLTKYCYSTDYGYNGYTDNLMTLETSDDAATVNWGNGWRTPSLEEMRELRNNCYITEITGGNLYTSQHNGMSIILETHYNNTFLCYDYNLWANKISSYSPDAANTMDYFSSDRCKGLYVRPVCSSTKK